LAGDGCRPVFHVKRSAGIKPPLAVRLAPGVDTGNPPSIGSRASHETIRRTGAGRSRKLETGHNW